MSRVSEADLQDKQIPCYSGLSRGDGRERLKALVAVLPNENFHVLKYLCSFLRRVSLNEEHNRMNSFSLGIVFGPNFFR